MQSPEKICPWYRGIGYDEDLHRPICAYRIDNGPTHPALESASKDDSNSEDIVCVYLKTLPWYQQAWDGTKLEVTGTSTRTGAWKKKFPYVFDRMIIETVCYLEPIVYYQCRWHILNELSDLYKAKDCMLAAAPNVSSVDTNFLPTVNVDIELCYSWLSDIKIKDFANQEEDSTEISPPIPETRKRSCPDTFTEATALKRQQVARVAPFPSQ